jgi:hypothetical protein
VTQGCPLPIYWGSVHFDSQAEPVTSALGAGLVHLNEGLRSMDFCFGDTLGEGMAEGMSSHLSMLTPREVGAARLET